MFRLVSLVAKVSLFAACLIASSFPGAQAEESNWIVLFDGTSTEAWRGYQLDEFPKIGWDIDNGALHRKKDERGGDLVTREQFGDFELSFEWKVGPESNSGVMYRVHETHEHSFETGPEYQVLDDVGHEDGERPQTSAAALYGLYPPEEKSLKPVGEWNEGRIVLNGARVEHWLNGKKVVEAQIGGPDWKKRISKSKFHDWSDFAKHPKGHIAIQDHGDEVWYRNIKIRPIAN